VASPPVDVSLLLRQAQDLREDLARETAAHETALRNATAELEQRVAGLEGALANERADHRRAVDEIERARSEARREAGELRAAVNRLRNDLAQIDAATAWFEYWSGTAQPPPA
jgi:chromosome segregation ATPase